MLTLRLSITIFLLLPLKHYAQVSGCTDPQALNYNAQAEINDGSCFYASVNLNVTQTFVLNEALIETSGLIFWNNKLWTMNDDSDTKLYAIDSSNGNTLQNINLPNVINHDWEEISQDENYVYIGDFGNNAQGNRTDLHILRVSKNSLLQNAPAVDTIWFHYANQVSYDAQSGNTTEFDCEAMIVTNDSIYLFKKMWTSQKSTIYRLPKVPGNHTADSLFTLEVSGLITGATYLPDKKLIALCGYSSAKIPFLYLLYDYPGNQFHKGNKRRMNINLALHQVEGIATRNGLKYYISNEKAGNAVVTYPQQLHILDLTPYLNSYVNPVSATKYINSTVPEIWFSNQKLIIHNPFGCKKHVKVFNMLLQPIFEFTLSGSVYDEISIPACSSGIYLVQLEDNSVRKIVLCY